MYRILTKTMPLIALALSATAVAEATPEDAAKYRQSVMKALSGHNGAISMIVRGKAGNPDNLGNHVKALANLASETNALFDEGTDLDDDRALSSIWDDPEAFADAVDAFEASMLALNNVAQSGELQAIDAAHREMAKTCKGCHEEFRQEKED